MNRILSWLLFFLGLLIGGVAVWFFMVPSVDSISASEKPKEWVAKVGDEYITTEQFQQEMALRGGKLPGQFQSIEQKKALLDELVYQKALVIRAKKEKIDRLPEVKRSMDQMLTSQVLRRDLRKRQDNVSVTDEQVQAFYDANAQDYVVPERRRVAMIQMSLPKGMVSDAVKKAEKKMAEAREKALKLDKNITHFGYVAQEYSDDQASRYRGGILGWLNLNDGERYGYDRVLLQAAGALEHVGDVSKVLRTDKALYLVRLVDVQEAGSTSLEELAPGIRQRLRQEGMKAIEQSFKKQMINEANPQVRINRLQAIKPLSQPSHNTPPTPPALPAEG